MSIIRIKVLFFASAREKAGTGQAEIELISSNDNGHYASTLLLRLTEKFPELDFEENKISVAVNKAYLGEEDVLLKDGDEVALLPPISGG